MLLELDSLTIYNVVDNETDGLSPSCAACCAGYLEYTPEPNRIIQRLGSFDFNEMSHAGHGLSLLLVGEVNGATRTCMFDAGPDPELFETNIRRQSLEREFQGVETIVLSHYHIDHSGGLRSAVPLAARLRRDAGLSPVVMDLHPDCPVSRGILTTGGYARFAPENPNFDELERLGAQIHTSREAHAICDGFFGVSGEIKRSTTFETGMQNHHKMNSAGEWQPDPLISDERFVVAMVRGKGLIVLSACSHAGAVLCPSPIICMKEPP
jgi:7,8-dihydropterin-6-yl-methyl-4-(beta-D-ribofuranosyl)aminobenzene 5'-phosphate synthase